MNKIVAACLILITWSITSCREEVREHFTGSGTIEATEIRVGSELMGRIVELSVQEGDTVEKGALLVSIDVERLRLQHAAARIGLDELDWNEKILDNEIDAAREAAGQAETALAKIKTSGKRIANLFNDNAATQDQLDTAETERRLAESKLRAARIRVEGLRTKKRSLATARAKTEANLAVIESQIDDGTIVSPTDGTVLETFVETGETIVPGIPVCTVADLSTVRLIIYVGEQDLGKLKVGGVAEVQIDSYPDRSFPGTVTWISQKAEFTPKNVQTKESRIDLVYAVRISIDNGDGIFKIGMPADAYIEGL
ncbi:MAG: efflux RND transporter periplasmic adaptor subunit [Candidatus Latescibacteria bacterium]|nr:efflux RND transporter periplasmic adaptor subunit [Candidatus Latescibacterota bacterium]